MRSSGYAISLAAACGLLVVTGPAAAYCDAAGYYTGAQGDQQVFVAGQAGGTWGFARCPRKRGAPSLPGAIAGSRATG